MENYKETLQRLQGQKDALTKELEGFKKNLNECITRDEAIREVQRILQVVAQVTQEQFIQGISDIVQSALDYVFSNRYKFVCEFKKARGNTVCELKVVFKETNIELDPIASCGGGVVDILAFSLRVALWRVMEVTPIIVLDEPFKFLSSALRIRAVELMNYLAKTHDVQFICVSHDTEVVQSADKIIEVQKVGKYSQVKTMGDDSVRF